MSYSTKRLDHLGIVSGVFDAFNIKDIIDEEIPSQQRHVTHGEAVKAMVLNALGFTSRALYLTEEFFRTKPIELIRESLEPSALNDDTLGRTLDQLYQIGVTELFAKIASHVMTSLGERSIIAHLDSSSFSFAGSYHSDKQQEPEAIKITRGYSKDHRPDQVQAGLVLICDHITKLPMWMECVDGNSSDKTQLSASLKAFKEQLQGPSPLVVMDSAFYTEEGLKEHLDMRWISRPPLTIKAVKTAINEVDENAWITGDSGLTYQELNCEYAGIKQRWFLVHSEAKATQERRTLEKNIEREAEALQKQLKKLKKQNFDCEEDTRRAGREIEMNLKYHRFTKSVVQSQAHYDKPGRPKAGDIPNKLTYSFEAEFEQILNVVEEAEGSQGLYLIATNELDAELYPAERVIKTYKAQGVTVERGFRFLKDPMFFADSLFLKKPSRLMSLMMVMTLSLLVYSAAEFLLRKRLAEVGENVPNQVGKPTSMPTLRRVFQVFEGIEVLTISQGESHQRVILNLHDEHRHLLRFMEPSVINIYLGDQGCGT